MIAGALVKWICNLENMEGFMCNIGGLGLICNYNLKTRGLNAKSINKTWTVGLFTRNLGASLQISQDFLEMTN
jgi:hypothetical protein